MKGIKIKREDIYKLLSRYSDEDSEKWADEFNALMYKKEGFISNVERDVKIKKILKRLGENNKYVEMRYALLGQIILYVIEYGIQRGDVFNVKLETERYNLFKKLAQMDNFNLYLILRTFQGVDYFYQKRIKKLRKDILALIERYDEIDFADPKSLDLIGSLRNSVEFIEALDEKHRVYVDPYFSVLPMVKKDPRLYTKALIPIYKHIMLLYGLKTDNEFIQHIVTILKHRVSYVAVERALQRYREDEGQENP